MKLKLNISQRDKSLLLVLLGMLLLFVSYYFGFQTFREETQKLKVQNEMLDEQILTLEEIAANKDMYASETAVLREDMDAKIETFPADMIAEDIILYVKGMENDNETYIASATLPGRVQIPINQELELDKLEMTDDITGVVSANRYVNDGTIPDTAAMIFSCIESDISYSTTYRGLKKMIKSITEDHNRKSVDNISLVFNENTGNLSGTMTVNYFILQGSGKEYMQPEASQAVKGIECIFGTLND